METSRNSCDSPQEVLVRPVRLVCVCANKHVHVVMFENTIVSPGCSYWRDKLDVLVEFPVK